MKLTLIILSFLLLFQKNNTHASAAHPGRMVAVKAFVLERKKLQGMNTNSKTAQISRHAVEIPAYQYSAFDVEEDNNDHSFDVKKYKVLCGFFVVLPSLYRLMSPLTPPVKTHERFIAQIFNTRYIVQRSLRI
jgi:hypothetical protein